MARLPRLYAPGQPQLILQRSLRGEIIFRSDSDYRLFQEFMLDAVREHRLSVHAYVLMPDHLILLATPADALGVSHVMQSLGRRYVRHFNHATGRAGTLWEGRFRSTLIDAGHYLLPCSQFIETCPVRSGHVAEPASWTWSSHAHHIGHTQNPLILDHLRYWELGNTPFERQAAYRTLFDQPLPEHLVVEISDAMHKGWALGDTAYLEQIGKLANRRLAPLHKGRPRKAHPAGTESVRPMPQPKSET